jgi:UDP-glucose 4-epimerase
MELCGCVRVLVTGGAGFIGSHLVDRLVSEGFEIIVLDDFSSGKMENLKHHLGRDDFVLIHGDVRDFDVVRKAVEGVDVVFHLAAVVSVPLSVEDPVLVEDVNVGGTLNVLKACVDAGVRRFVFAGSCAVYGEGRGVPRCEDDVLDPISPYAVSKLAGEFYCRVFYRVYGLEAVVLRYFNVYGPRQVYGPYSGVISIFINRLLRGEPPVIFGDGNQVRDFVFVEDVVEATMLAMFSKNAVDGVFNVGSGRCTSINELAKTLIELIGVNVEPVYSDLRPGDIRYSCADISRTREVLGFKPKVELKEGLLRTIKWFKEKSRKAHG